MANLLLNDLDETLMDRLRERADDHDSSPCEEATQILLRALVHNAKRSWEGVDAIYARLAASGKTMSDSVDLIREDRQR